LNSAGAQQAYNALSSVSTTLRGYEIVLIGAPIYKLTPQQNPYAIEKTIRPLIETAFIQQKFITAQAMVARIKTFIEP
jgi:hypothetical protein